MSPALNPQQRRTGRSTASCSTGQEYCLQLIAGSPDALDSWCTDIQSALQDAQALSHRTDLREPNLALRSFDGGLPSYPAAALTAKIEKHCSYTRREVAAREKALPARKDLFI